MKHLLMDATFGLLFEALTACLFFRWYFAVISVSGVFAVTFSVIFAYVADITQEHERSTAYGLVRTFSGPKRTVQSRPASLCNTRGPKALVVFILIRNFVWLFLPPAGIGYLRSQPGHQPCHRGLPVRGLRRHAGGDPGHGHRPPGHLLHPGGRAGVPAGEDEAGVVGSAHLLGAGRPFCCE